MRIIFKENFLRIALFGFNFIFAILSVALVALGVVYMDDLWWPRHFLSLDFLALSTFIIVLGCLSFMNSMFGCYCAKSHNMKYFRWFVVSLVVLLLFELGISTIAFLNLHTPRLNRTLVIMETQLTSSESSYNPSFSEIEDHYSCCAIHGIQDYVQGFYIPKTCCVTDINEDNCTLEATKKKEYTLTGCLYAILNEIHRISSEAAYFMTGIVILQTIQFFAAAILLISKYAEDEASF